MAANAIAAAGWQVLLQLAGQGIPSTAAGLFISPLSLYIALVLTLNGAGVPSSTHRQIWGVLRQPPLPLNASARTQLAAEAQLNSAISALQRALQVPPGNGTELVIANALWTKEVKLNQAYKSNMSKLFQATVQEVPNAAPINAWAAKVTKGLIKQVVPANQAFNVILTNAVYFKGQWLYGFSKTSTQPKPFTTLANKEVQVPMMTKRFSRSGTGRPVLYTKTPSFSGVRLPYKGSNLSAVILLPAVPVPPTGPTAGSLPLATALNLSTWMAPQKIDVQLPRFKVKNEAKLTKVLKSLGMVAAFNDAAANFQRMSATPLFITDVLQSVVVNVDEVGTEAAAVTSVIMLATSAVLVPPPIPKVVFDRPFLFNIVDDTTGTVLFQGWVTDPSKSAS